MGFSHNKKLDFESSGSGLNCAEGLAVPGSALDADRIKLTRHEPLRKSSLMVLTLSEGSHRELVLKKERSQGPLTGMSIQLV